jgi:hypothetical protein
MAIGMIEFLPQDNMIAREFSYRNLEDEMTDGKVIKRQMRKIRKLTV